MVFKLYLSLGGGGCVMVSCPVLIHVLTILQSFHWYHRGCGNNYVREREVIARVTQYFRIDQTSPVFQHILFLCINPLLSTPGKTDLSRIYPIGRHNLDHFFTSVKITPVQNFLLGDNMAFPTYSFLQELVILVIFSFLYMLCSHLNI